MRRRAIAVLLVAALVSGGCSSAGEDTARSDAMERLRGELPASVDDEQLACYVDRVADELAPELLEPGAEPSAAQVRRRAEIRLDCLGAEGIGVGASVAEAPPATRPDGRAEPWEHGDDPELDELWDRCAAGDLGACDELFEVAPPGSLYEDFAARCGDREPALRCEPAAGE